MNSRFGSMCLSEHLGEHLADGRDIVSFCTFSFTAFTGPARQPFRLSSPYPPLSEKYREITTTIFRLFVRETVFMGSRWETIVIFFRKNPKGCFLSLLVITPPRHSWLSPLLVALTGEGKTEKMLWRPGKWRPSSILPCWAAPAYGSCFERPGEMT
jgi:hypothetical protein